MNTLSFLFAPFILSHLETQKRKKRRIIISWQVGAEYIYMFNPHFGAPFSE